MEPPIPLKGVVLFIAFGSMVTTVLIRAVTCFCKLHVLVQLPSDSFCGYGLLFNSHSSDYHLFKLCYFYHVSCFLLYDRLKGMSDERQNQPISSANKIAR